MKKALIIIAAVLGGLFILGSCGVFAVAVATAPPTTKAATSSSTPAPSPSVTTPTPAPTPKATPSKPAKPKASSQDEQYAEFLGELIGAPIDTDTPEFRELKGVVLDMCVLAEDARKDGVPAATFAAALAEGLAGEDDTMFALLSGMYVYCPTEFAWLDAGVNGTSQAA